MRLAVLGLLLATCCAGIDAYHYRPGPQYNVNKRLICYVPDLDSGIKGGSKPEDLLIVPLVPKATPECWLPKESG